MLMKISRQQNPINIFIPGVFLGRPLRPLRKSAVRQYADNQ